MSVWCSVGLFCDCLGNLMIIIEALACPASNLQMDYIPLKRCVGVCKIKGERKEGWKERQFMTCDRGRERKIKVGRSGG